MNYRHSVLGLAAGTALLVATGCGKQESPATPAVDSANKAQSSEASAKQQPAQTPKAPDSQPAASAKPDSGVTPDSAATITPPTTPSPAAVQSPTANPVAAQPQNPATDQPAVKTPVATGDMSAAPSQSQKASLAQVGTNQLQALAKGMTNQVTATTTNQVQALLEQAKNLTSNQKYQEALTTLTQLYETKLTPEQKQQADDIKAQVQTAMAQKAASSLGSFLGGKK